GIALFMRYVMMPQMNGPASVLWSLPLLLILILPTMHRTILKKFAERYTFGNWFRGSFLYTFTWLALTFVLVNPPLADIAAPEIAGDGVLLDIDNPEYWQTTDECIELNATETTAQRTGFAFAVRDNQNADDVNVTVVLIQGESEIQRWTGNADDLRGDWDLVSSNVSGIGSKSYDVPILVEFDQPLESGSTYRVVVNLVQEGDPWMLDEDETWEFKIGLVCTEE
ncbi:MAG: hypothetical protein QF440_06475, partial [Candidatus Thalassarchaeaceae archaeon]|nr:hypothetical protein [Candidatus Thalassarchaeaceae archaeon]